MAQLVAHLHGMQGVRGSNPLRSTLFYVERLGVQLIAGQSFTTVRILLQLPSCS